LTTPLLYNPVAGRGKLARAIENLAAGKELELFATNGAEETRLTAGRLAADHHRILVAGGDGTLHHAIRGIDGSDAILGIVAGGTGNDFASALGLPLDIDAAVERALTAQPQRIDLGRAGEVPFAGIAGVGIVADVLNYLDVFTRRYRGNWVYPWAIVRTVASYRPLDVIVESDAASFEGPAMIAVAANAPRFGGGMLAAPEASMRDGLLDVVILKRTGRVRLIRILPRVYRGTHVNDDACVFFRAARLRLTSRPPAVVYADGEALPLDTGEATVLRSDRGALLVAV